VDFTEGGFMKEKRLVGRAFTCVFAKLRQYEGKNKNRCLEMSVNNLCLLEGS
jgi:hypothetical protein